MGVTRWGATLAVLGVVAAGFAALPSGPAVAAPAAPQLHWTGSVTETGTEDYTTAAPDSLHYIGTQTFTVPIDITLSDFSDEAAAGADMTGSASFHQQIDSFDGRCQNTETENGASTAARVVISLTIYRDGTFQLIATVPGLDTTVLDHSAGDNCSGDLTSTTMEPLGDNVITGPVSGQGASIAGAARFPADPSGSDAHQASWQQWSIGYDYSLSADCPPASTPPVASTHDVSVVRAQPVILDGSGSTAPRCQTIVSYRWSGVYSCDQGGLEDFQDHVSDSPRWGPFTALCSMLLTLTVTDSAHVSATSPVVKVDVQPRGAPFDTTPVIPASDDNGDDVADLPEEVPIPGVNRYTLGLNVSSCESRTTINTNLCPGPELGAAHPFLAGGGYTVDSVDPDDPGPFANMSYVRRVAFTVPLLGIINKAIGPDGQAPPRAHGVDTYGENMAFNANSFLAFRAAIHEHENLGQPGVEHSGHTSSAQERIAQYRPDNVNQALEPMVAATREDLLDRAENALTAAELDLRGWSNDVGGSHLAYIGSYEVLLFSGWGSSPGTGDVWGWGWFRCDVGGTSSGHCAQQAKIDVDDHGRAAPPGSHLSIDASGFAPGEGVSLELHSDPVALGTLTADSSGRVHGVITIPRSVPAGAHTLILSGGSSGIVETQELTISATGQTQLAATGSNAADGLPIGAGAVLLGIVLLLRGASRRRRLSTQ